MFAHLSPGCYFTEIYNYYQFFETHARDRPLLLGGGATAAAWLPRSQARQAACKVTRGGGNAAAAWPGAGEVRRTAGGSSWRAACQTRRHARSAPSRLCLASPPPWPEPWLALPPRAPLPARGSALLSTPLHTCAPPLEAPLRGAGRRGSIVYCTILPPVYGFRARTAGAAPPAPPRPGPGRGTGLGCPGPACFNGLTCLCLGGCAAHRAPASDRTMLASYRLCL